MELTEITKMLIRCNRCDGNIPYGTTYYDVEDNTSKFDKFGSLVTISVRISLCSWQCVSNYLEPAYYINKTRTPIEVKISKRVNKND